MSISIDVIKLNVEKYRQKYMKMNNRQQSLPIPVVRALRKLGRDIGAARRRRRIPIAILAERAGIHRETLGKIEKGEPGVLMAHYASVLFALGLADRLGDVADIVHDTLGRDLEEESLPKRIYKTRRKSPPEDA